MYPLDDNIFDKPETSTEEILSKTQASFTLLQTETPSLISESPSETPVSSYKSSTEKQAVVAKHFSVSHSRPGGFSETQHVCMVEEIFHTLTDRVSECDHVLHNHMVCSKSD